MLTGSTEGVTNLSSTVCSLLDAETNKGGVCHLNQDVIYTVHMDELYPPPLHVVQNPLSTQCSVETPVPVWKTNTDTHLYLQEPQKCLNSPVLSPGAIETFPLLSRRILPL